MHFLPTYIPEVIVIEPDVFSDERGFFMESWERRKFSDGGIVADFVQDNHSRSRRGTLRGLHYQLLHPQGKLVRVILGEVYDVAVDLRQDSPTFGRWVGEYLSADNRKMLWLPPGFAHGFYVLSEDAEFQYKCTDYYAPENGRCLRWDDDTLCIDWPLIDGREPLVSAKDAEGQRFQDADVYP